MNEPPVVPALLAISDRRLCGGAVGLVQWARSLPAGVAVLLREKDLGAAERTEIGRALRSAAAVLIAGGSLEVAIRCGADGVHLRADQPWSEIAPAVRDHGLLLGVSTHSAQELDAAADAGADYALFGPVFASPEKARFGPPQGLGRLRRATRCPLPVLAVGGIDAGNAHLVADAGACGIAAIRAFAEPASAQACTDAWHRAHAGAQFRAVVPGQLASTRVDRAPSRQRADASTGPAPRPESTSGARRPGTRPRSSRKRHSSSG